MQLRQSVVRWGFAGALLTFGAIFTAFGVRGSTQEEDTVSCVPATSLSLTITGATLGPVSTVDFTLVDQTGASYLRLPASTLEVTLAKLVPGTDGEPDEWQSYINTTQTPTPGVGPGTEPTIIAKTDSGGSLVDHGDGTYTYTFGTDVTAVTSPRAVSFDPSLTHRIAIAIRSSDLPEANNAIYDWQPSTGLTMNIMSRDIVDSASCNSCHSELSAHGGPRKDVRLCVTCHNPGSTEANSGNTIDFPVMIHKIHDGAELPSVQAGIPYIIYGYRNSVNDYSDVEFPQDIRNCTKCHNPANDVTPDAHLAFDQPSIQVCGSCHDDIDFSLGQAGGHVGGVADNSQCSSCHSAGHFAGSVEESHLIPGKVAAAAYKYTILSVTNTQPGRMPEVTFSVTNPEDDDRPYDLKTDPAFTAGGGAARVYIDFAWDTNDYGNDGSGSNPGQPISVNVLSSAAVDNGDGTYTLFSPTPIPYGTTGSGGVALEGHPAGDYDGDGNYTDRVPVTSVVQYFPITDATAQPRRVVADLAGCQNCHGQNDGLSLHGSNRTDNVQLCVMCHNPNATDISQRPIDPDGMPNGVNTAAADGLEQAPINFSYMIHSIHGAEVHGSDYVIYGFGGSVNNFSGVLYPGVLANCTQCHAGDSYVPPLNEGLLGTTVDTHATVVSNGSGGKTFTPPDALADSAAFSRISPTASACSACHNDSASRAHMEQNGGSFSIIQAAIGGTGATTEACAVCHKSGAIADVKFVHGIE